MKKILFFTAIAGLIVFTQCNNNMESTTSEHSCQNNGNFEITAESIEKVQGLLVAKYGREFQDRIERGVKQVALLWNAEDGGVEDFENFCLENFINLQQDQDVLLEKLSRNFEILNGHFNRMSVKLKEPLHLDTGEITSIDRIFGGYDPSAHVEEDLYANRIAFIVALNFPFYSLKEKSALGSQWNRKQWAFARAGDRFTARVPSALNQKFSEVSSGADTYISEYNIFMEKLRDKEGNALFPKDLVLISHWGLRDELKSNYTTENGFERQKMIYEVMKRIITQEIPESVINSIEYEWSPFDNTLKKNGMAIKFKSEPNTRYSHMLEIFKALSAMDKYSPHYNTYIKRQFDCYMEIPQEDVEQLFVTLLSSPQVKKVAELIKTRLGRDLQPWDIWYNGFTARTSMPEEELDKITRKRFPNAQAYQKELPAFLEKMGFTKEKAREITSKISVDPARGAGHAWGAEMKEDVAHLRTRIAGTGMNYKGYNIATHEFGHNVEQTLTLQDIDYYLLHGIPNTAFTEAVAFLFQKRDLELLGMKDKDENKEDMLALDNFWSCYEIMGVSLVDMYVWKWLYENPDATPEYLKNRVIIIAKDIWNKYYAETFGISDQPILAVYSHMIDAPLYLSAYP
ncbi:MAG: hypothetical protein KJ607_08180, partial [Bacteroidetes bacterium]|nr:hypothetical protein [Bacteroidota bacterium]